MGSNQVGRAWFGPGKSLLADTNHLVLHVPGNAFQEALLGTELRLYGQQFLRPKTSFLKMLSLVPDCHDFSKMTATFQ